LIKKFNTPKFFLSLLKCWILQKVCLKMKDCYLANSIQNLTYSITNFSYNHLLLKNNTYNEWTLLFQIQLFLNAKKVSQAKWNWLKIREKCLPPLIFLTITFFLHQKGVISSIFKCSFCKNKYLKINKINYLVDMRFIFHNQLSSQSSSLNNKKRYFFLF
jgi:hypothetical protein